MSKILEGNPTKKANVKMEYTEEQLKELRKCSAKAKNGHIYFMENYGYIVHPSKGKVLFKPFEYQKKLIDNYHNYRFSINMLARQLGKCVTGDTLITVRNKSTGDIEEISIKEFIEKVEKENVGD